jgi:hypothetical protein
LHFLFWRYSPNLDLGPPPWNSPFHFGLLDLRHSVRHNRSLWSRCKGQEVPPLIHSFIRHSVGHLGQVISSSQGLPVHKHRKTHTHTRTYTKHPFPEWDSNPRSQRPIEWGQCMPQTALLPYPAHNWLYNYENIQVICVFTTNELHLKQLSTLWRNKTVVKCVNALISPTNTSSFCGDFVTVTIQTKLRWWIGRDLKGNGRDIIELLVRHLPGGTEGNHEKSVKIAVVLTPRFEPNTSECTSRELPSGEPVPARHTGHESNYLWPYNWAGIAQSV